jgi:hydrogenase expression/formation protein HypE
VAKLLGVDPGFAACEGCFAAVVSADAAEECITALRKLPRFSGAALIGEAAGPKGETVLKNSWGALRELRVPAGDQLPRIC